MDSLVALYQTRLLLVSFSLLSHTMTAQACVNGDVRIEGTETSQMVQGIVQYCFNGGWSTVVVCTDNAAWTSNEGEVVCRQLRYDRLNRVEQGCLNNSTAFVELNCPSSPVSNLQECGVMEMEGCPCGQSLVHAKVECRKGCTNGEIRLEGGPNNNEGRVEVCVDRRWGTVQTSQPRQVAEAVCMINDRGLESFTTGLGTQYGYQQSKPVYHCDVSGVSEKILDCTKRDSESHNHAMDLGVVCGPPLEDEFSCTTNGESFRLTNGSTNREGRVEVCVDGRWGTVCNNSQEGIAGAVCSHLELPSTGATMGTGPQVTSELARKTYYCYSNTTCVEACCDHSTSLTVKCSTQEELETASTTQPQDVTTEEQSRGSSPDGGHLTTNSTSGKQEPLNQSTIALVALPVLMLVLVAAVVICVVVVVVLRRRKQSPPGTSTQRNESYSLKQLDDQVYGEATSTVPNYSSLGPGYDVVALKREEIDPYDVLDHNLKTNKPQPQVNPIPVRDEVSKRGDDFYDAEEHTYSVVNVKKKRKAKKNRHGDQNIPSSAGADTYEVIDNNKQKMTNKPQDKSVRDEAGKKEDDFYDAEEHTYAVVNKKKAKKTSEDSEGEREELPNNDSAMAGDSQT